MITGLQCKLKLIPKIVMQEMSDIKLVFNGGQCHRDNLRNGSIICALVPLIINPMHRSQHKTSIKCCLTMIFRPTFSGLEQIIQYLKEMIQWPVLGRKGRAGIMSPFF